MTIIHQCARHDPKNNIKDGILNDIPHDLPDGLTKRIINVDGVDIEYRVFKLPDGSYNVGTIFPVKK